ncbi:MAG: SRPBCC domain-containing protein [Rhodospirillales bacterium]|nr:SRPBCC domain-containing protein [Alphaproteobacteria bacterium]MCB1840312.1 SRPBCC domain-containing protein [Alphaproteobacteria bacterium]MCB9977532.1 SRPBCC domain-containing protein [Rhodospirillales bacterium]
MSDKPVKHVLIIERFFEAPRERVFEAWTDPDELVQWCMPYDFTIPHNEGRIEEGGSYRSCLRSKDGKDHWLSGVYKEIDRPNKLVFTHVWDDVGGKPGAETLVTVTFENHEGGTKMIFMQEGFSSKESKDGHEGGWSEAFEHLEEHLFSMGVGMI